MPFPDSSLVRTARFADVRLIGRGAGGQVYYARDNLGRAVAVKEVLPTARHFQELCEKLQKEAQIQATLQHPNIVHVYHLEEDPDSHERYLICEYVAGGSLADHLQAHGPIVQAQAIVVALSICHALEATSMQQIVHRDIKPSNILLLKDDRGAIVSARLGDFGVAQDRKQPRTTHLPGMLHHPGTPEYMAPEQADITQPVDTRTDLYALGITLWEMLTGTDYKLLFGQGAPPDLAAYNQHVEPGLAAIIAQATHYDRLQRYPTPQAMACELAEVRDGSWKQTRSTLILSRQPGASIAARPIQPAEPRAGRASEDRGARVTRTLAALAALLAVVVLAFWLSGLSRRSGSALAVQTPILPTGQPAAELVPSLIATPIGPLATQPVSTSAVSSPIVVTAEPIAQAPAVSPVRQPEPTAVATTSCRQPQLAGPSTGSLFSRPVASSSGSVSSEDLAQRAVRVGRLSLTNHSGRAIFSPDARLLAIVFDDGAVQLWQTDGGTLARAWCVALPANARIIAAAFAADSQALATGSSTGRLETWGVADGALLRSADLQTEKIVSMAFAPDGQTVAAGVDDGTRVQLFRAEDGQLLRTHHWNTAGATRLAYSPDGQSLAVGTEVGGVIVSRVTDGRAYFGPDFKQSVAPELVFAPDSRSLVVGLADGTVQLFQLDGRQEYAFDLRAKAVISTPLPGYPAPQPPTPTVQATMVPQQSSAYPAFAPDGQTFAASLEDGTVQFWRIEDGALLRELGGETLPGRSRLTFAPDGKFLAVATEGGAVDLWAIPR